MKQKLAIILCSLLVATSGSMPVYAEGQPETAVLEATEVEQQTAA